MSQKVVNLKHIRNNKRTKTYIQQIWGLNMHQSNELMDEQAELLQTLKLTHQRRLWEK